MSYFKTVKKSLFTLILALLAISTIAVAAVMNKSTKTENPVTYYYNGPSENLEDNVMIPGHWETTQSSSFSCGGSSEIPCNIQVPAGKTIDGYLKELNTFTEVMRKALSKRNH